MVRIPLECFEFAFEWLESLSNGSNLHSIASNLVRMIRIWNRTVGTSLSIGSNLDSMVSNLVQTVRICIRMVKITFEWFEFAFDCFESRSNASNLNLNG